MVAVVVAALALAGVPRPAAAAGPTFVVSPAQQTVNLSAGTVQVQIQIQNATNVANFGFVLHYDPGVLKDPQPAVGPFLASSGRVPDCPPPVLDNPQSGGPGTIQFGCATPGQGRGADGSGVLATITFTLAGGARTALNIDDSTVADALANIYCRPCTAVNGSVDVTGGDASKDRGVATTPPANPTPTGDNPGSKLTGTPASGPGSAPSSDSGSGAGNGAPAAPGSAAPSGRSSGPGGSPATGTTRGGSVSAAGSGARAGTAASGSAAGATQTGKFGSGPPPASQTPRNTLIGAIALSIAGLALVGIGVRRRKAARL
ncbi:MAG: hypothetical protein IVW36_11375 [Dehalococcoidia bacterium]|nr:hypothetical protein [Dehalococcoidia bacterium]